MKYTEKSNKKWYESSRFLTLWIPLTLGLTVFDQMTKLMSYLFLNRNTGILIIPHVLQLQYLENRGAAFGMLRNQQWLFVIFAVFVIGLMAWFFVKLPDSKKYYPLRIISCVLAAGALGNMLDRVLHAYVIDFIYFSIIDFPIFNVADIYVVLGSAAFLYLILFRYKEEDFDMLLPGKKKRK